MVGDIRDTERVNEVIKTFKPQIVFHAAAYKHVPMMEHNPDEAVKVNIFGTYITAKTAAEHAVEKFIMISTDKAVRPTSVMGATKRVAEYICTALNDVSSRNKKIIEKQNSYQFGSAMFWAAGKCFASVPRSIEIRRPAHSDSQRYAEIFHDSAWKQFLLCCKATLL